MTNKEYFLEVEFNKEHIFYSNMMLGNLEGTNDSMFYTIKCSENLKETEISSYIQYLFDNIILINIWRIDYG